MPELLNISNLDSAIGQLIDGKISSFKMSMMFTNPKQVKKIVDIVSIWNYTKDDDNARIILYQQPDHMESVVRCNVENGVFKSVVESYIRRTTMEYFRLGFGAFQYDFFEYTE